MSVRSSLIHTIVEFSRVFFLNLIINNNQDFKFNSLEYREYFRKILKLNLKDLQDEGDYREAKLEFKHPEIDRFRIANIKCNRLKYSRIFEILKCRD